MVLSNSPGDVKQQQQYVLTSMCCPPGGKPLALVLERGCVAKGSGGDPEMRIGYGQCGLQSSLQLFIPQWLNLSSDLSCLQKKNHTFVTTALAPAFSPKAYQRQPSLFLFSSAFWLFTSHETGDEREIMTSQAEFLRDSSDRGSLWAFQSGKLPPGQLECKLPAAASQATECFPGPEHCPVWTPQIFFVLEKLSISMWHNQ